MNTFDDVRTIRSARALSGGGFQPAAASGETANSVPLVTQYLRVAYRWRWLILGSIVTALLLGVLTLLLSTPQYTATTRVEVSRTGSRIVDVEGVTPEATSVDNEFYQTQYSLLQSQALAERVARKLRLQDNRAFFELHGQEEVFDESSGPTAQPERMRAAVEILLERLSINPIRLSRLVDVHWTGPDPALAARVANTWSESFIEFNLERRFEATAYARRFLEQRIAQLRGRLEESERQLVTYASSQAIINIPVGGTDENGRVQERSLTADTLAALNEELARATADRVRASTRLRRTGEGTSAEALASQAISGLRQRRAETAAELARLQTQFESEYPPVQALAAQVRQLDGAIAREEGRVLGTIQNVYQDAVGRERELAARVEALKQSFLDQRRRSIQYNIIQRDVDTNRELYNGLLQRYREIGVAGGVGENNIAVVDTAIVPEKPSAPRPLLILAVSLLVGAAVGVALALVREQIDETITDPQELEKRLGVPLIGVVPSTGSGNPINDLLDPKSPLFEAYLSVHTSLSFSTDHGVPKVLVVTSTRPAEGKSTTSYALAYVLARNGARVVLVDGDMRSPSVHGDVGLGNSVGLSSFLSGATEVDAVLQETEREPFAIVTAGPQPPNAAELLRGDRLAHLMRDLSARFDHVIIDSPPVMGLADAPIFAGEAEAVIYVVEARGVKARLARVALARLQQSRAHIIGTILTKFEARRAHYGYGYEYGYGYGSEGGARKE